MNHSSAARQPTHDPGRRRTRRALVGAVAAATVLVVGGGSAPALGTGSAPADPGARAAAPGNTVLRFTYDGRGGLREGDRVRNTAGKGRGIVHLAQDGRMKKVKGKPGRAVRFPLTGFGIIEAADRRAWDPRRRDFSYGTKVKVSRAEADRHSNLVQKGYYRQPGGQWKLQLDRGLPSCVVNGDEGRLRVRSTTSIADGAWHRLLCRRTDAGLVLRVDGAVAASGDGATGRVANAAPVRVGSKKLGPGRVDQFRGRLDVTFLSIG